MFWNAWFSASPFAAVNAFSPPGALSQSACASGLSSSRNATVKMVIPAALALAQAARVRSLSLAV